MRWLTSTNHKDIGSLYLWFSLFMLFFAGTLAMLIRAELFQPGLQLFQPAVFNQLTTMHGLIMIFGAIMPSLVGFANWQVPLMIGASDMAFPRLNNWSFWLLPAAGILLISTFFVPGGALAGGWTMYPPLFMQGGIAYDISILAIHILGISSIMGSINIIVTILNMQMCIRDRSIPRPPSLICSCMLSAGVPTGTTCCKLFSALSISVMSCVFRRARTAT